MAQRERCRIAMQRMALPAVMATLAMASPVMCRADEGTAPSVVPQAAGPALVPEQTGAPVPENSVKSDAPGADIPRARVARPQTHRTAGQAIDETVRRMTRVLSLDAVQQQQLRGILIEQQRQMRKLRDENSQGGTDWVASTVGIVEQTKTRIRAMLNEDQKKKYSTEVPPEMTAPAHADLQHWMQIQESNRQKDNEDLK